MARLARALALAGLAGCTSLLGIHDPDDPGAVTGDVTGTWRDDHLVASGTTTVDVDLSAWDVSAYVPDPAEPSGFVHVPARITGPGTFVLPDLPASYLVRIEPRGGGDVPRFFQATSRTIDLGRELLGRPDLADTTLASSLALDLAGPVPYWSNDILTMYSLGANTATEARFVTGLTPHKGFRGAAPWTTGFYRKPARLLAGDDLWVLHGRASAANEQGDLVEAARLGGVSLTDGLTTPLAGTFQAAPAATTVPVGAGGDYRAALGLPPAVGGFDVFGLAIYAGPGHAAGDPHYKLYVFEPLDTLGPTLYSSFNYNGAIHPGASISFANPFPADWQPIVVDSYAATRRYVLVPGTRGGVFLGDQIISVRPLGAELTYGPMLTSPRNVEVGGAAGDRTIPLAPAVVRWDPVAGASHYTVTMERLERQPMTIQTWRVPVAELRTTEPTVTIPGELLAADQRYVFHVAAVVDAAGYRDGRLRRTSRPHGIAITDSGVVVASATCGNGRVDPGEECDTGGASASCDFDCTLPACGDGVINTAAGEVCDGVGDAPCAQDCKGPPVCGNAIAEIAEGCDDGNQLDGDGCSSQCKVEDLCGNGRIDQGALYEECDDGNQINDDGCSNTCRRPFCGDGMRQAANGEDCDDGNGVDGDGCDHTCHVEAAPTARAPGAATR